MGTVTNRFWICCPYPFENNNNLLSSAARVTAAKIQEVKEIFETAMDQPEEVAQVHVQCWYPGVVVEETVESHPQNDAQHQRDRQCRWHLALEDSVHEEASALLSE